MPQLKQEHLISENGQLGTKAEDLCSLSTDVKLIIHNDKTGARLAFGPGVAELCMGIKRHGSIKAAAEEMNMAYSKGWKIIGEAEDALNVQLVARTKSKGCELTEAGNALLEGYLEIIEDISKYADFRFKNKFC